LRGAKRRGNLKCETASVLPRATPTLPSLRGAGASVEPVGPPQAADTLPARIAAPSESDAAIPKTFRRQPRPVSFCLRVILSAAKNPGKEGPNAKGFFAALRMARGAECME